MKKIAMMFGALMLFAAPAFAGQTSAKMQVHATVLPSCEFVSSTPASFSYSAASGSVAVVQGSAVMQCNAGTVWKASSVVPNGPLALTDGAGSTLNAMMAGQYSYAGSADNGADTMTYSISVSADAGQWDVPNGAYSGTTMIYVNF